MIELELAARRWQFIKSCTLAFPAADQCSRHFAGEKTLSKFNAKALHNISPCRIFLPHREQRPATESLKIILRNLWLEVMSKPDRIICVKCGEKKVDHVMRSVRAALFNASSKLVAREKEISELRYLLNIALL